MAPSGEVGGLALAHQGDGRPPPLRPRRSPCWASERRRLRGDGLLRSPTSSCNSEERAALFPIPFPHDPIGGKREAPLGSDVELVAIGGSADTAGREELGENVGDVAGAHAGDIAQLALGEGRFAVGQDLLDTLQGGGLDRSGRLSWVAVDDGERERRWIGAKGEVQPSWPGAARCSMARCRLGPVGADRGWSRPRRASSEDRAGPGRRECAGRSFAGGARARWRRRTRATVRAARRAARRRRRRSSRRWRAGAPADRAPEGAGGSAREFS